MNLVLATTYCGVIGSKEEGDDNQTASEDGESNVAVGDSLWSFHSCTHGVYGLHPWVLRNEKIGLDVEWV